MSTSVAPVTSSRPSVHLAQPTLGRAFARRVGTKHWIHENLCRVSDLTLNNGDLDDSSTDRTCRRRRRITARDPERIPEGRKHGRHSVRKRRNGRTHHRARGRGTQSARNGLPDSQARARVSMSPPSRRNGFRIFGWSSCPASITCRSPRTSAFFENRFIRGNCWRPEAVRLLPRRDQFGAVATIAASPIRQTDGLAAPIIAERSSPPGVGVGAAPGYSGRAAVRPE